MTFSTEKYVEKPTDNVNGKFICKEKIMNQYELYIIIIWSIV